MLLVCAGLPFWADVSYLERGGDLKWESLADFKNPEAFQGSIDLSGRNLADLPKNLLPFTNINRLDLGNNRYTSIPDEMAHFKNLKILRLDDNMVTSFDSSKLPEGLQEIMLDRNQLKNFSDVKLANLKIVTLESNPMQSSDMNFSGLESLELIHIGNSRLTALPESACTLKRIEWVSAGNNLLTVARLCFKNPAFKMLNLYKNQVRNIIIETTNIRELHLGKNLIQELPTKFRSLNGLSVLRLENNELKTIDNLPTNLTYLMLQRNQIETFTHNCQLGKLESLNLNSNKIQKIDLAPKCFPNLTWIDLRGNLNLKFQPQWLNLPQIETIVISKSQFDGSNLDSKLIKDSRFRRIVNVDDESDFKKSMAPRPKKCLRNGKRRSHGCERI